MRRILLALATAALATSAWSVGIAGQSPAPAASPDAAAPAATTLTWVTVGTEDVPALDVLIPGGYRLGYRSHGETRSDDPRLVGQFRDVTVMDATIDNALARYTELVRIETADGAWQGSGTGHISAADGSEVALVTLTGEGAYDGLSLLIAYNGPAMERHTTEHPDIAIVWPGLAADVPDVTLLDR